MKFLALVTTVMGILLVGCSSTQLPQLTGLDEFEIIYPEPVTGPSQVTGSIMDNGASLYPAGRAYAAGSVQVGDIVTILLAESAQASRVMV